MGFKSTSRFSALADLQVKYEGGGGGGGLGSACQTWGMLGSVCQTWGGGGGAWICMSNMGGAWICTSNMGVFESAGETWGCLGLQVKHLDVDVAGIRLRNH